MSKKSTADEILARALRLNAEKAALEDKAAEQAKKSNAELAALRSKLIQCIEDGEGTGDHIQDLAIRHHGLEKLSEVVAAYRAFEERLRGHKGEYFLIAYEAQVPWKHTFSAGWETRPQHCFRLGLLDGEALIWHTESGPLHVGMISVPVSRYVWGNSPPVKENIFVQRHVSQDPSPPMLGRCVLQPAGLLRHQVSSYSSERSVLTDIVIGDKAVEDWMATHPHYIGFGAGHTLKDVARALEKFDLEPMGENEGPLPQGPEDSLLGAPVGKEAI